MVRLLFFIVSGISESLSFCSQTLEILLFPTSISGTNVNDALLRGIAILKDAEESSSAGERASLIMFLMDGEPTAGIVSSDRILTNVRQVNNGTSSLYCLGMDKGVDFSFLQKVQTCINTLCLTSLDLLMSYIFFKNCLIYFYKTIGNMINVYMMIC